MGHRLMVHFCNFCCGVDFHPRCCLFELEVNLLMHSCFVIYLLIEEGEVDSWHWYENANANNQISVDPTLVINIM